MSVRERQLVVFAHFADVMSADALVAFLTTHEIAAHVDGADPLTLGLGGRVRVVLAEEDLRRARWALDDANPPDTEAWLLATGEPDREAATRAFEARVAPGESLARQIALRVGAVGVALLGALPVIARCA